MARKKKRVKRRAKRKTGGRAAMIGSPGLLAQLKAYHGELDARVSTLQSEMEGVAAAIGAMEGVTPRAGRALVPGAARRGPRPAGTSLKDYIIKVLGRASRPMSVKDLGTAILNAGYQTRSRNLGNQISMALAQLTRARKVKKVGRGMYRA
jgi:hypothetical protein